MLHDLIDLVDRQFCFLEEQQIPEDFVLRLAELLGQLASEPRIGAILQDLHRESQEALRRYRDHEEASVKELVGLREELQRLAPECAPASSQEDIRNLELEAGDGPLAFDRLASKPPKIGFSKNVEEREDPARTLGLVGQIRGMIANAIEKLKEENRTALEELLARVNTLSNRHVHNFREFWRTSRTHAGVALGRLAWVANALNPSPQEVPADEDVKEWIERGFTEILSGNFDIREAVFARTPPPKAKEMLERLVQSLRREARKLHEELRRRIGLRRSLLALVHRFKNRCEWHDAERLREIVKKAKGKKEDPLTAEFSKYLFDQGLDPLTRPRTADLEPDVLSFGPRSKLYVEAKQYRDENRSKIRRRIKDAAKQVLDTVGRLRGTVFEPWEAVLLVFRRGGPLCANMSETSSPLLITVEGEEVSHSIGKAFTKDRSIVRSPEAELRRA